jgi:tetratricopeptide (TPR) repeat protein
MKLSLVVLTLALAGGLTARTWAEQQPKSTKETSKPADSQNSNAQTGSAPGQFPFPEEQSRKAAQEAAPRSDSDSSSKDNRVDLSPPPDDSSHPGSDLLGPEPAPGVVEMKPWNPHKADKDVEVGLFYFKQRNYPAAESRFREALHWQDNHAEATYRLATVLEKEGRPDEAKQYYLTYLRILPGGEFAKECKKAIEKLAPEDNRKAENKAPSARP